jgi:TPR repeat protein
VESTGTSISTGSTPEAAGTPAAATVEEATNGTKRSSSADTTAAADTAAAAATTSGNSSAASQPLLPSPDFYLDHAAHPELTPLSDAAFTLASLLATGLATAQGLPRDDARAAYVLHRSALAGGLEARLALAERYLTGRGVPRLEEEGLRHAKVAGPQFLALLDETGVVSG